MEMNVMEFDRVAREIFAPVYPVLAEQIKKETGITRGVCLDAGAGGGYLAIALAGITSLDIILLDQLEEVLAIADQNIAKAGLKKRLRTMHADIHEIPLDDCSVDVVVSRGSVFFWEDSVKAFREIHRILVPGGLTFIGGGFGSVEIKKDIDRKMLEIDKECLDFTKKRLNTDAMNKFHTALIEAGVPYEIRQIEAGFGIIIKKEAL